MNDADPKNAEKSRHSALPGEEREIDPEWAESQAAIAELLEANAASPIQGPPGSTSGTGGKGEFT